MTFPRLNRIAAAAASLLPAMALANPSGGTVVAGTATIGGQGSQMVVTQTSNNAVINWNSFSVGANESVQFVQPNASSAILNRVTGGSASNILGNISSNGRVFLVNPNGIVFGYGSVVNVGSLVATTLDVSNERFMNGEYAFARGNAAPGSVVNRGTLVADGGNVVLLADQVNNEGIIRAQYGNIILHAGSAFALSFDEDGLINYELDEITAGSWGATSAQAGVNNSGTIEAIGGTIYMTAAMAQNVTRSVVNNTGTVSVTTVVTDHYGIPVLVDGSNASDYGGVVLSAGGGNVELSGAIYGNTVMVVSSGDISKTAGAELDIIADGLSMIAGNNIRLQSDNNTNTSDGYNSRLYVYDGFAIGYDAELIRQLQENYPDLVPYSIAPNAGFQAGGTVELGYLFVGGGYLYARAAGVSLQELRTEAPLFYNYRPSADNLNINVDINALLPIYSTEVTFAFGGTDYDGNIVVNGTPNSSGVLPKDYNPATANYVFMSNGQVNGSNTINTSGVVAVLEGVNVTPNEPPPSDSEVDLSAITTVLNELSDSLAPPVLALASGEEAQLIEQQDASSEQCQ